MTLKAAVIGCGNIAKFHFDALEQAGVKVSWVCDLNEDATRHLQQRFGAKYTADYRQAVTAADVDVVDITTITRLHPEICDAAIKAGKAVICEKTLSENADDSWNIARQAEQAETIFYTSYMKRFIPAVQKAKELMPSMGRILSTYIRTYQCWGDVWTVTPEGGFFHTPEGGISKVRFNTGGGILYCGGSHILDLVLHFLGRPHKLYAYMYIPDGQDYDLQASCMMGTNNGIVHYEALGHPLKKTGFLHDGWDERFEINGTGGRLEFLSAAWDKFGCKPCRLLHYDNTTGHTTAYDFGTCSPFASAISYFCENISNGVQGEQSVYTGYEVDELIDHIKQSSQNGKAMNIKWKN